MAARKITVTALGVSAKVDPDALDDQDLLDKLEDANVAAYELEAPVSYTQLDVYKRQAQAGRDGEDAPRRNLGR